MPRISLWKDGRHTNDYKFIDRRISEMFTIGGTGINIHKYLGSGDNPADSGVCDNGVCETKGLEGKIQDLLFLENRDRIYDPNIYNLRGVYQLSDTDFDLSQFGLFLSSDTIFITFHLKDMYDQLGRKIMAGDVFELPHLTDYYALDEDVPAALRRYYVVQDASRPAEGYSPTWWPHLWRAKCTPLVDSQEYHQLLTSLGIDGKPLDNDLCDTGCTPALKDLLTKPLDEINDKIVEEAEGYIPLSGYDTSEFYVAPVDENGDIRDPLDLRVDAEYILDTEVALTADIDNITADRVGTSPRIDIQKSRVYLLGDGKTPNGFPLTEGNEFPLDPAVGDFHLRTDYQPDRLFRFDGKYWIKIEDNVRARLTNGQNETLLGRFYNEDGRTSGNRDSTCGGDMPTKQALYEILRPKADN